MDKKLLSALNNLSVALQEISDSLKDKGDSKRSNTTLALQSGNLDKKIISIDEGIKKLKDDNQKILKNQETIINLSKNKSNDTNQKEVKVTTTTPIFSKKDKSNPLGNINKKKDKDDSPWNKIGNLSDPKQKTKLKEGLSSILMIATGVLAIGLAFKIVGGINFLSVISLSIALPLVALAFEKIAKMKDLKSREIGNIIIITVAIATAITLSSFILQFVRPVGLDQLTTSILIAGMFTVVSYGLSKILSGIRGIRGNDIIKLPLLPLIMVSMSLAILLSSYILQFVRPVGLFQLTTSILIAGMFTVVSYGLGKIIRGLRQISISDVARLSLLPIIMVAMAGAIALSSHILYHVKPVGLFQLLTSVFIAATFVVLAYSIKPLTMATKGITIKDIGMSILILLSLTGSIVLSSYMINLMPDIGVIKLLKFLATGIIISIIAVTLAITSKIINSLGKPSDYIKSGIAILAIATSISLSSWILSSGNYTNLPDWRWSIGAGLTIVGFAIVLRIIDIIGNTSTYLRGGIAILAIAAAISLTSLILSSGNYSGYPSTDWIIGAGIGLLAFGAAALILGFIATSGVGAVAILAGCLSILAVAATITGTSHILASGKYNKYPTKEWATGVGISMLGFALSAIVLGAIAITGVGAVVITAGLGMILLVAGTVVTVAEILGNGKYNKYPDIEWSKGVGNSLAAFGMIMSNIGLKGIALNAIGSILGSGPEDLAKQMLAVDNTLDPGKFIKYPNLNWADGVSKSLSLFASITNSQGLGGIALNAIGDLFGSGPEDIAKQIISVDKELSKGSFQKFPAPNWVNGVMSMSVLASMFKSIKDVDISDVSETISNLSKSYDSLSNSLSNLGNTIDQLDMEKLSAVKNLTGSIVLLSLMDSDQFENMMDALEEKASIFVDIINDIDKSDSERVKKGTKAGVTSTIKTSTKNTPVEKNMNDIYSVMVSVDQKLSFIVKSNDNLSKYVDEIRGDSDLSIKNRKN